MEYSAEFAAVYRVSACRLFLIGVPVQTVSGDSPIDKVQIRSHQYVESSPLNHS